MTPLENLKYDINSSLKVLDCFTCKHNHKTDTDLCYDLKYKALHKLSEITNSTATFNQIYNNIISLIGYFIYMREEQELEKTVDTYINIDLIAPGKTKLTDETVFNAISNIGKNILTIGYYDDETLKQLLEDCVLLLWENKFNINNWD